MREHWIDSHHVLVYDIKNVDESFDHAFGSKQILDVEIEVKAVIAYIGGFDYDITGSLPKKWLDLWAEDAREKEIGYQRGA